LVNRSIDESDVGGAQHQDGVSDLEGGIEETHWWGAQDFVKEETKVNEEWELRSRKTSKIWGLSWRKT